MAIATKRHPAPCAGSDKGPRRGRPGSHFCPNGHDGPPERATPETYRGVRGRPSMEPWPDSASTVRMARRPRPRSVTCWTRLQTLSCVPPVSLPAHCSPDCSTPTHRPAPGPSSDCRQGSATRPWAACLDCATDSERRRPPSGRQVTARHRPSSERMGTGLSMGQSRSIPRRPPGAAPARPSDPPPHRAIPSRRPAWQAYWPPSVVAMRPAMSAGRPPPTTRPTPTPRSTRHR